METDGRVASLLRSIGRDVIFYQNDAKSLLKQFFRENFGEIDNCITNFYNCNNSKILL